MLLTLFASAWLSSSVAVKPNTYSERWLCDLWAGAVCHRTSCNKDAKERCNAVSKACNDTSRKSTVPNETADKKAACARALLKGACGEKSPAECQGMGVP